MNYSKPLKTIGMALGAASLAGLVSTGAMADESKGNYVVKEPENVQSIECTDSPRYMVDITYSATSSSIEIPTHEGYPPKMKRIRGNYLNIIHVNLYSCQTEAWYNVLLTVNGKPEFYPQHFRGKLQISNDIVVNDKRKLSPKDEIDYKGLMKIEVSVQEHGRKVVGEVYVDLPLRLFKREINLNIPKSPENFNLPREHIPALPLEEIIK